VTETTALDMVFAASPAEEASRTRSGDFACSV